MMTEKHKSIVLEDFGNIKRIAFKQYQAVLHIPIFHTLSAVVVIPPLATAASF